MDQGYGARRQCARWRLADLLPAAGGWIRRCGRRCGRSCRAVPSGSGWTTRAGASAGACGCWLVLAAWAVGEGLPLDVEVVLDPDTVERFIAVGLADDRSRATYRAVLRRVGPMLTSAGAVGGPAGDGGSPPGGRALHGCRSSTGCGPTRWLSRRGTGAGGSGAAGVGRRRGLDGRWVARVAADDVTVEGGMVLVRVGEPSARVGAGAGALGGRGPRPGGRRPAASSWSVAARRPGTGPARWPRRWWSPTAIRGSRRRGCGRRGW